MIAWLRHNPNKVMGLIWPTYLWGKAVLAARFGYHVLPETDSYVITVLTAFGIAAVSNKAKTLPAPKA